MPATKTRPATKRPPTMEQVEEARLAESLEAYREAITEAADGRVHDGSELAIINAHMRDLGIPGHAWPRHVAALQKMRSLEADLDKLLAGREERELRVAALDKEAAQAERRLAEIRGERNQLAEVVPRTIGGLSTRIGQLRHESPAVFYPSAEVVKATLAAQNTPAQKVRL